MKKPPISKDHDVGEVKWRLFDETVSQVRESFIDVPISELNDIIEKAVANARQSNRR